MNTVIERKVEDAMKFIINGRTFDTAGSIKVAFARGINHPSYNNNPWDCEVRYENTLYRTVKGSFFVHTHQTQKFVKGGRPVVIDEADENSAEEAIEWIKKNGAVVIDDAGLPMPDEA